MLFGLSGTGLHLSLNGLECPESVCTLITVLHQARRVDFLALHGLSQKFFSRLVFGLLDIFTTNLLL